MKSRANATASKWLVYKPRWDGDLIGNMGLYHPVPKNPENPDDYYKTLLTNAEHFMHDVSRNQFGYNVGGYKQAMFNYAASSGYHAYELAARFPEQILDHSLRQAPEGDTPHLTIQGAGRVLDPENMGADVFMRNYVHAESDAATAARFMPDTCVVAPHHREMFLRALKDIYPMTFGAVYEDLTFEVHFWGGSLLFDYAKDIHERDHQWSRNAIPEEAMPAAAQFGKTELLQIREGQNYDTTDLRNRPISLVDRAWEVARHIVDVTTWEVAGTGKYEGQSYSFRTDPAAAYLAILFMYDEFYRDPDYMALDRDWAHPVIKAHYADDGQRAQFAALKDMMLPYLAQHCDTMTLRRILDNDPALARYWDEQVKPQAEKTCDLTILVPAVLSYVPRGGFYHADLQKKAQKFAAKGEAKAVPVKWTWQDDPKIKSRPVADKAQMPPMPLGLRGAPTFDASRDPSLFNDRNFARLGGTSAPDRDPNPDQYNRAQLAAIQTASGLRETGLRPAKAPRKFFYLDDPQNGLRASHFRFAEGRRIDDPRDVGAAFDAHAEGGKSYRHKHGKEAAEAYGARVLDLLAAPEYAEWREEGGFGNVQTISDIVASLKINEDLRGAFNTEMYESIAAPGPMRTAAETVETIARRLIGLEMNATVIPAGNLTPQSWRLLGEAVLATIGKTPRDYEGGMFDHEIFVDFDYDKPAQEKSAPQKQDLADLIVRFGLPLKEAMEKQKPLLLRDEYVTLARMLDVYEKIVDPARCNVLMEKHQRSGKAERDVVLDLAQIDPYFKDFANYDPGLVGSMEEFENAEDYQRFLKGEMSADEISERLADPVEKAKLAKYMWFYMRRQKLPGHENLPVEGMMLIRGIQAFDRTDLIDLPDEYDAAFDLKENLQALNKVKVAGAGRKHIKGPSVSGP